MARPYRELLDVMRKQVIGGSALVCGAHMASEKPLIPVFLDSAVAAQLLNRASWESQATPTSCNTNTRYLATHCLFCPWLCSMLGFSSFSGKKLSIGGRINENK